MCHVEHTRTFGAVKLGHDSSMLVVIAMSSRAYMQLALHRSTPTRTHVTGYDHVACIGLARGQLAPHGRIKSWNRTDDRRQTGRHKSFIDIDIGILLFTHPYGLRRARQNNKRM